jgi:hypothetical protein
MANTLLDTPLSALVRKGALLGDPLDFLSLAKTTQQNLELPRGAISEILGHVSSGRTALLHAILTESQSRGEICAFIDCSDAFDPASARTNGVALERLLWVRCNNRPPAQGRLGPSNGEELERVPPSMLCSKSAPLCGRVNSLDSALKAADWILHGGGFGVVVLDLCDASPEMLRRVPLPWWYRFRRAVENTSTILAIATRHPAAGSCSSCIIQMERRGARWSGSAREPVLDGLDFNIASRKPIRARIFDTALHASLAS